MPDIKDSAGEGGVNKTHDVAMVQAMLRIVKNAKNVPYLGGNYDGFYGGITKTAIITFQTDHKLAATPQPQAVKTGKLATGAAASWSAATGATAAAGAAVAGAVEKLGFVAPGGPTIQKLAAMLPADRKDLRIIENTKTVYLEGVAADAAASRLAVTGDGQFDPIFRAAVGNLIDRMFDQHKIVLWLTPTGRRRTFAQQQAETKTNAGPGESNHNFGRAVDIGFRGFKWIQGNGEIKQDADWLNALEAVSSAKSNALWDARDAIATLLGLFRLQMERVHLQAFNQATLNNPRSLVKLLNTVGTMKWDTGYKCNLGFGGPMFYVGTARQIYAGNATVTAEMVAQAKTAQAAAKGLKTVFKASDCLMSLPSMKQALKGDFERADANWIKWVAVP